MKKRRLVKIPNFCRNWIGPLMIDGEECYIESGKATVAHFREAYRCTSDKNHEAYDPEYAADLAPWLGFLEAVARGLDDGSVLRDDCLVLDTVEKLRKQSNVNLRVVENHNEARR